MRLNYEPQYPELPTTAVSVYQARCYGMTETGNHATWHNCNIFEEIIVCIYVINPTTVTSFKKTFFVYIMLSISNSCKYM